ncbi:MAG: hypothetical protein U0V04_19505 [Spirosomataceae bacterium]
MENYQDYLKQVSDLGGSNSTSNNFLTIFLRTEYSEGYTYEGDLLNNLPHGQGVLYYPNKRVFAIGEFEKGRLQGFSKTYNDDGKLWQEGTFLNGRLEGNGREYFQDKLKIEGLFKQGNLSKGKVFDLYERNDLQNSWAEVELTNNNSSENYLYGFGTVYRDKIGRRNSDEPERLQRYKDTGDLIFSKKDGFSVYLNGEGKYLCDDILIFEGNYLNGDIISGKWYHSNGNVEMEGNFCYENGYFKGLQGNGKVFDHEGNLLQEGMFINGEFYRGKQYSKGYLEDGDFINNELDGLGTTYHSNGVVFQSGTFENGNLKKGSKYSEDYLTHEYGEFLGGRLYGKGERIIYFDSTRGSNVKFGEVGEFRDGILHGIGHRYWLDGDKFEKGEFKNGVIQGK